MRTCLAAVFVAVLTASIAAQRASTPGTTWGDPDVQGTYTNTYENGTSFERPDQFAGWDGDTLVVETTNFKERSVCRNASPEKLKITERFSRMSPQQLRWVVTYECHEGNYGLRNILSAARAEERQRAR